MIENMTNKPQVVSLFSGIGGFDLGFEQAGFEVTFQCEINTYCHSVLQHHWPNVISHKDITKLNPDNIPGSAVWCGGFPCQDLSVARGSNGRHGLNGSRSGLFYRLAELAGAKQPKCILIENVHGLLNSNMGKDFAELLYILNSLGYSVAWRLLNSRYFGVPQSRPRVYICAWKDNPIAAGNVLFEDCPPIHLKNEREGFLTTSWKPSIGPIPPKLAFCLAATSGRHTGTDWSRTYIPYNNEVRRLTPLECERLQGFPDNWTKIETQLIDIEKADSLRYHALGNAVTVNVIRWIANRIKQQLHSSQDNHFADAQPPATFLHALNLWPGLRGPKSMTGNLSKARLSNEKTVWPNAGLAWKNEFITNNTKPSLSYLIPSDLIDIIETEKPEPRYFLSANAAEGILRRVASQNRYLFPPLQSALEHLSGRKQDAAYLPRMSPNQQPISFGELECV